jgi:hypothetical protein
VIQLKAPGAMNGEQPAHARSISINTCQLWRIVALQRFEKV